MTLYGYLPAFFIAAGSSGCETTSQKMLQPRPKVSSSTASRFYEVDDRYVATFCVRGDSQFGNADVISGVIQRRAQLQPIINETSSKIYRPAILTRDCLIQSTGVTATGQLCVPECY